MQLRLIVTPGLLLCASPVFASPGRGLFEDGAIATGSFVYDTDGAGPDSTFTRGCTASTPRPTSRSPTPKEPWHYSGDGHTGGNYHEFGFVSCNRALNFDAMPLALATSGVSVIDYDFSLGYLPGLTHWDVVAGQFTTTAPLRRPPAATAAV